MASGTTPRARGRSRDCWRTCRRRHLPPPSHAHSRRSRWSAAATTTSRPWSSTGPRSRRTADDHIHGGDLPERIPRGRYDRGRRRRDRDGDRQRRPHGRRTGAGRGDPDRRHVGIDGRSRADHQGGQGGDVRGDPLHPRRRRVRGDRRHRRRTSRVPDGPAAGGPGRRDPPGRHVARRVSPTDRPLAVAGEETRPAARAATDLLKAKGGTAIGSWLTLARRLFEHASGTICHAILLTDGQNQHESDDQFRTALEECEGRFQCDCRGIGTGWEVRELRQIASTLLGSVDMVADADDLVADFTAMMDAAMGKEATDVALRLWTPQGAEVAFVRQVAPAIEDLTSRARASGPLSADYPTGAWGDESRDYHVSINVPAHPVGGEMAAGRVSLVVDGEVVSQALIRAVWTDDRALSTRISREVAHYSGQTELMEAIQDGLAARKAGDDENATFRLGRAVQLAAQSGNTTKLELLEAIVDVEDAATGTIRLKRDVADGDEMMLDTRSTKTLRVMPAGDV